MLDLNIILVGVFALNSRTVLFVHRSIPDLGSNDPVFGIERYIFRDRAIPFARMGDAHLMFNLKLFTNHIAEMDSRYFYVQMT